MNGRASSALTAILCAASTLTGLSARAEAQERQYSEATRVTAVDVTVEVQRPGSWPGSPADRRGGLEAADVEVLVNGERRPVVGLQDEESLPLPWYLVIYVDTVLASDDEIRWAAGLLGQEVETLLGLGTVDLVVADPQPRQALAATQDQETLAASLSNLALEGRGRAGIATIREAYLAGEGPDGEELTAADALAAEASLVQHRLDTLLLHLSSQAPAAARRAVLWVGAGIDLEAAAFYEASTEAGGPTIPNAVQATAETLGAYGWLLHPLVPEPPENRAGIKPGFRIGKLRFTWGNDLNLPGFTVAFEEERDAEKADAYLELGETQLRGGDLDEAAESFAKALHHYYGDPRTADAQARAYTRLGEILEKQGKEQAARDAFEVARELTRGTGEATEKILAEGAEDAQADRQAGLTDIDGAAAAEVFAEATAGRAMQDRQDLQEALAALPHRLLLTYQVEGTPTGQLADLELRVPGKSLRLRAPPRMRSGTPETVSAARGRRALLGELEGDSRDLRGHLEPKGEDPEDTEIVIPLRGWPGSVSTEPGPGEEGGPYRLTVARADFDGRPEVYHLARARGSAGGDPVVRFPLRAGPETPFLAVVLEDLSTGLWGAQLIDQD